MKILKVYLDTSVIGGCFDEEFKEDSNKLIEEIRLGLKIGVVSEITIEELNKSPNHIKDFYSLFNNLLERVNTNLEIENLAEEYVKQNIVTRKYLNDAGHIAHATFYNADVLVSWNFKHIVNFNKIIQFNAVNIKNGFKSLQIYSPKEVLLNV